MKLPRLRLTWPWALLALGVALGSLAGEFPENTPNYRGGYRVLDGDFHVHTRFSDGFLSPLDVVLLAKRKGLDVIGLTEHNMVRPGKLARWLAEQAGGLVVIPGEEVTTRDYHLIALGLEETVRGGLPLEEALARVHAQGGFAIAAHPVRRFWPFFDGVLGELDGMEVMHPIALRSNESESEGESGEGAQWSWRDMVEYYEKASARTDRPLAAIGSSDFHFFNALGVCRTLVFAENNSAAAVLAALRAGRTVVYGPEGEAFGDPALIELLAREPLPVKKQAPAYESTGLADSVGRTAAWLGLLALIFFRRAR